MSIFNPTPIHEHIIKVHKNLTIGIYFFYVQSINFLHSISRKIQFRTSRAVKNLQKKTMVQEARKVTKIYTRRGFKVVDIHVDQEFKCIVD